MANDKQVPIPHSYGSVYLCFGSLGRRQGPEVGLDNMSIHEVRQLASLLALGLVYDSVDQAFVVVSYDSDRRNKPSEEAQKLAQEKGAGFVYFPDFPEISGGVRVEIHSDVSGDEMRNLENHIEVVKEIYRRV